MKEDEMKNRGKKRGQPKKCTPDTESAETVTVVADVVEEASTTEEANTAEGNEPKSEAKTNKKKKSPRKVAIPRCPEDCECCVRCQAYREGRCAALADVTFKDNVCPFYKDTEEARAERIASMEKLEDTGREDLIKKYYGQKFDRVLGDELVGTSYGFDDDHCVYVDEKEITEDVPENNTKDDLGEVLGISEEAVI